MLRARRLHDHLLLIQTGAQLPHTLAKRLGQFRHRLMTAGIANGELGLGN